MLSFFYSLAFLM